MIFNKLKILILVCFFPAISYSQVGGDNIYEFLNLVSSAKIAALGGQNISITDNDVVFAVWNPALLKENMNNQLALNYVNYFAGINYGSASYMKRFEKIGNFSSSIKYVDYGSFIAADPSGTITGVFYASDYLLQLGWGMPIDSNFSVGANFKNIYSVYESYSSFGVAFDIAALYYNKSKQISATLLVKNAGLQLKSYIKGNREPLPFEIQAGFTTKLGYAPLRWSITLEHLEKFDLTYESELNQQVDPLTGEELESSIGFGNKLMRHVIIGGEVLFSKNFNIQFGYNFRRRQELKLIDYEKTVGLSFGTTMKISKFDISYSRASFHAVGPSNYFSVVVNIDEWVK